MGQRTCAVCEVSIEGRHGKAIYCSRACGAKAIRLRDPEQHKRHQARYRASAKGRAKRLAERVERTCVECGTQWLTPRRDARLCSDTCRSAHYSRTMKTRCILPADHPVRVEMRRLRESARPNRDPKPRLWVSGPCNWCGVNFTTYTFTGVARYCSDFCTRKRSKATRRAREAGASGDYTWSEVTKLWLSIGKRCAYCDEPKRNDEIEPDHVVPLSKGGSNSITNVVPACHPCNGDKRDLSLAEWMTHRELRELEPRTLNVMLTHLTWAQAA